MIMKQLFTLTAAATILAACSINGGLDQTPPIATERVPLSIGAIYGEIPSAPLTRSASTVLQGVKVTQPIGLYILKGTATTTQTGASLYEHFNLSSTSLNDDTPVSGYVGINTGTTTLFYPDDKDQGISIYAYSPYVSTAPGSTKDISSDLLTLTTASDQKYEAGYLSSDFLWGRQGEVVNSTDNKVSGSQYLLAKTAAGSITGASEILASPNAAYLGVKATPSATVHIPMVHLGSKIIVKVAPGTNMDITRLKGATVSFYTDTQKADLKLQDGTLSAATGNTAHSAIAIGDLGYSASGTAITTSTTDGSNGVQWNVTSDDTDSDGVMDEDEIKAYWCAGVILPQTINAAASNTLISITLNGTSTSYVYKEQNAIFAAGKVYQYNITVNANGLSLTTSVTDWIDGQSGTPVAGNAELE